MRVWGCRRCGVVTTSLNGYGWCPDCVSVEAWIKKLDRMLAYDRGLDEETRARKLETTRAWRERKRAEKAA